jgi:hypothetical protein
MGFVELRLYIFIFWSLLAVFSIGVSSFKVVSKIIKADNDKKGFFYRLFVFLSVVSMAMGWFLMIYGIYDPKATALLLSFNKQLYAPMTWFGIATLYVIPVLILLPDDNDENNKI